ncbi:uncharacterized protein RCO7_04101 [Rhynchosporium graminicola]|uniref:Thioesterase n=1 Tax=Rhynchosporium graminicola TaxID=2792576 RepID=A0A1E1LFG7_9HELO|nr:uncharacterized protein RCO7_04101 [Rhynchosporium commune]
MASANRLPLKSIAFTSAIVVAAGASKVSFRNLLTSTFTGPGSYSRILAALIVLANIKNVPFAWHYRVFNAILKHCLFSLPNIPPPIAPSTLFLPVITSSHAPLTECDYNFHKSNSTYFSDLDVTRSHLVCALLQPGIKALQHNKQNKLVLDQQGKPVLGKWSIMLGGVMCSFKREIGMYQGFEMWSRMLCWDRKWIYVVTHFVKKGTVKPRAYILTDGSWFRKGYKTVKGEAETQEVDEKAIFASAISKYVIKLGRLTTHPEISLEASGLLPPKPGGWAKMGPSGESTPETLEEADASEAPESEASDEWDWKRVERENKRGLKFAEHFGALDGLHQEFTGSRQPALGRYRDFMT